MRSSQSAAAPPPGQRQDRATSRRAAQTKARIAEAVITVLAEEGLSRLTHRLVAKTAGVSLAATTYHYATKRDMVADASGRLLDGYLQSFHRVAARSNAGDRIHTSLADFAVKLLTNAADSHRRTTLAWCEIILDAARSAEGHALARGWFDELARAWGAVATALGVRADDDVLSTTLDTVIGLLFITLPLGLTPPQVREVLLEGRDPGIVWRPADGGPPLAPPPGRPTRKAHETRERIMEGAIGLLVSQGAGAVTYKAVAEASGLTTAAPAYHFGSIVQLLRSAEAHLFAKSKARYRDMLAEVRNPGPSLDLLSDLTAAVFVREATEHGLASVAIYSIWLEAARRPDMRPEVSDAIFDQVVAWTRRLKVIDPAARPVDAMRMQALYVGKLVRVLSMGAPLEALALARGEFRDGLRHGVRRSPK